MSSKKVFVIIGATGAQGSAVARHILKTSFSEITVRAILQNPFSAAATSLRGLGAEVVKADLNDKPSLESAFQNATYIFSVRDYFDTLNPVAEITYAVNFIDAACTTALHTLQSFIWSSLPDTRNLPIPFQHVLHFNTKAEISKHLRKTPLWDVSTEVWVSGYFQNYIRFREAAGPQRHDDGSFVVMLPVKPTTLMHITDVNSLGPLVEHIISDPLRYHAETILLSTQTITPTEQVQIWADALAIKAEFRSMTLGDYVLYLRELHGFPEGLAREMGEIFACHVVNSEMWTRWYGLVHHHPEYEHDAHVIKATDILGGFKDWETWVKETDWNNILVGPASERTRGRTRPKWKKGLCFVL